MDPGISQVESCLPGRRGWGLYIQVVTDSNLEFDFGIGSWPVTLILFAVVRTQRRGTPHWAG